ncbi:hypothetical protein [Arenimonas donghaensis]|uniref:hypothetical protein n=1 Tax=Arenimonas donghaensis TaxID=375061 RepID=UPI001269859F|nr:hypothetical protein [Arenimonas donghaensis]
MSFDQAKDLADANEKGIERHVMSKLVESQGNALSSAMANCARPGMDLSAFTVVLSLKADGSVAQSWRRGDTPLAQCVHKSLEETGIIGEWSTPFFTSIELSFDEH